jgi:ankyrin repeat protein
MQGRKLEQLLFDSIKKDNDPKEIKEAIEKIKKCSEQKDLEQDELPSLDAFPRLHYGYRGYNALHKAVVTNNEVAVELLLTAKANVDKCTHTFITIYGNAWYGQTPLSIASQYGYYKIVELLINAKADLNRVAYEGRFKHEDYINYDGRGKNALALAVRNGHTDVVEILLNAKANVDYYYGHALKLAAHKGQENIIKKLLEAKADPHNKFWFFGKKASQLALDNGNSECAKLLIDAEKETPHPSWSLFR